ncbi:hypothetical protein SAMN05192548_103043 [Paraburkholderia terricola]|uniref:Uncharacterized protein n=1 Tax=Paraburkholderia terricola TaxID=169427 RepID=A0A1M6U299_9BURK|nr:hypothetical protein SAMN05192547_103043 [Paraburkholderia sediminicola]SHK63327.1 hypothetical protein SAMN05192548_103043 [Paraburkholderia terricola]
MVNFGRLRSHERFASEVLFGPQAAKNRRCFHGQVLKHGRSLYKASMNKRPGNMECSSPQSYKRPDGPG